MKSVQRRRRRKEWLWEEKTGKGREEGYCEERREMEDRTNMRETEKVRSVVEMKKNRKLRSSRVKGKKGRRGRRGWKWK